MNNDVRITSFIVELKKLEAEYKVQVNVKEDDSFCAVVIRDEETGKEYDMDGVCYE